MSEGMVQPVLIDRIRDVVGRCLGFLTAAAHRNADGAVLKHRDIDLRIAECDRIFPFRMDRLQQPIDGYRLVYGRYAQITKQSDLALSAPGACFQIRKGSLCVQKILVALQDEADLVDIAAIQVRTKDHLRKHPAHAAQRIRSGSFALLIEADRRLTAFLKMRTGVQSAVAFQIKLQPTRLQPVDDCSFLLFAQRLFKDDLP